MVLNRSCAALAFTSIILLGFAGLSTSQAGPQAGAYIVDSDADAPDGNPGDGICDTAGWLQDCTLHAAIQEANLDGVPSLITFASPLKIQYASLPTITERDTTIDASYQWDGVWPQGRPGVQITPGSSGTGTLVIWADATIIRGVEFLSCGPNVDTGVHIRGGSSSRIGGTGTGQRNVFSCGTGVHVQTDGSNSLIIGNYFGTWDGENTFSSDVGVEVEWGVTTIEENLFGGHQTAGVLIWRGLGNNLIRNNIVGANKSKNAVLPNAVGISISHSDTNTVQGNFIAGNTSHGLVITRADDNLIAMNVIGHSFSKMGNGGDGLQVLLSKRNQITQNQIGANSGNGLWFDGSDDNLVQSNYVSENGWDGVYLHNSKQNLVGAPDSNRNHR